MKRNVLRYLQLNNGKIPVREWLLSLDVKSRARIEARIDRLERGNFGDVKHIYKAVFELREHFGKGYRIYFAKEERIVVLLINGGDKVSQKKDIKKAVQYWSEYKEKKNENDRLP